MDKQTDMAKSVCESLRIRTNKLMCHLLVVGRGGNTQIWQAGRLCT